MWKSTIIYFFQIILIHELIQNEQIGLNHVLPTIFWLATNHTEAFHNSANETGVFSSRFSMTNQSCKKNAIISSDNVWIQNEQTCIDSCSSNNITVGSQPCRSSAQHLYANETGPQVFSCRYSRVDILGSEIKRKNKMIILLSIRCNV